MHPKGILFDFDGVVVKSMEQHYDAWSQAFAEKNVHIEEEEFFLLEGQGIETIAAILGKNHGLNEKDVLDIISSKVRIYYQSEKVIFYDHFHDLVTFLRHKTVPLGVVTGGNKQRVKNVIETHLKNIFDAVVTIDDVQHGKPHPEPFLKGAEKLGIAPQVCLVVENAPLGIRAAKAAGCTVIAIKTTLDENNLAQADFIADDFKEVHALISQMLMEK